MEVNLLDLRFGNRTSYMIPKHEKHNQIYKLNFIKIKNFHALKNTIKKWRDNLHDVTNIFK